MRKKKIRDGWEFEITMESSMGSLLLRVEKEIEKIIKKHDKPGEFKKNIFMSGHYYQVHSYCWSLNRFISNASERRTKGKKCVMKAIHKEVVELFDNDDSFQDIQRTITNIERVYETVYDCKTEQLVTA